MVNEKIKSILAEQLDVEESEMTMGTDIARDLQNDKDLLNSIGKLKQQKKAIDDKLKELEDYAKNHFDDSKWEDSDFKYTISTSEGKASFDKNTFSIENPTIDIMKYYTKGSSYKTIRCTAKKKGN